MQNIQYKNVVIGIAILLLASGSVYFYMNRESAGDDAKSQSITATFICKNNKIITATFTNRNASSTADLVLSDGRTFSLPQVISGSGARYANPDESFVFWNKGDTAFITEGVKNLTTYEDCLTSDSQTASATTTPTTTTKPPVVVTPTKKPTTPTGLGSNLSTYTNDEYGFKIQFPKYVTSQNFFTTFYQLPSTWRINPSAVNQGKAVTSFIVHRIDQGSLSAKGKAYPLYFTAELRIGVGPNVKECYSQDAGYTNQTITNVSINGIPFKRFSFADAGMMKYVQGESYRTIHNNMCYVLEQVKAGSSYRDELMLPGTSEGTLQSYYDTAGTIAKTFSFTK